MNCDRWWLMESWQRMRLALILALGFAGAAGHAASFVAASKGAPNISMKIVETAPVPNFPAGATTSAVTLPLSFEPNRGQADGQTRFLCRGGNYVVSLEPTAMVVTLTFPATTVRPAGLTSIASKPRRADLRMRFVGADPAAQIEGVDRLPGKSNYFIGNNPAMWRTDIPNYAKVRYREIYPGIDMVFYEKSRRLEYDFVVRPGADPDIIKLAFEGHDKLQITDEGDLLVTLEDMQVRQHRPTIYQLIDGSPRNVVGRWVHNGSDEVGFELQSYDRTQAVWIDPVLSFGTYIGGTSGEGAWSIAIDSSGNAYVAGSTASVNYPVAAPAQGAYGGGRDGLVAKLNADGTHLLYSTYLGGSRFEKANSLAVDAEGNAYVAGETWSADFPVTGALQGVLRGQQDAFVVKLNASGSALTYATFLGGNDYDKAESVAVDAAGNAFVMGETWSSDFPIANAYQAIHRGNSDVFVAKLNPAGDAFVYSTYVGGSGNDNAPSRESAAYFIGGGMAVDASGNAFVAGNTMSKDFPLVQPSRALFGGGTHDAYVFKLNAAGTALVYSTYLGGSAFDAARAVAVDRFGSAYVTGLTSSGDFPTTLEALQAAYRGGDSDGFVTKLGPDGASIVYSTFLGGNGFDQGRGIAVDEGLNAFITGATFSLNFPMQRPFQSLLRGHYDAFVVKLNPPGAKLVYSTFLGGTRMENYVYVGDVKVDSGGAAYVSGATASLDFPTVNPIQATYAGGDDDVFVAKLSDPQPSIAITMTAVRYDIGDTVTASDLRFRNPRSAPAAVHLKLWLKSPNAGELVLLEGGGDGSLILPPGFDQNMGPLVLGEVTSSWPPSGTWQFNSSVTDPITGDLLDEYSTSFVIR
jgi:hypothetical protein